MDDSLEIIVSGEKLPQMDLSFHGGNGYDPMHELMRAMVLRAIDDYNSSGEIHDEAVDYLNSTEEEYIFSFIAICKHFGLDPAKTRYAIMNATHRISTRRRAA
ncbi:MAG: hypothetical protein KDD55_06150 [Bdellovibrionales bacterium]|nr:hypothetical protein [Bdellovibrionales bacterium]